MKPSRHESQHRMLIENKKMSFGTTYNDNFKNFRVASGIRDTTSTSTSGMPLEYKPENIAFVKTGTIPVPNASKLILSTPTSGTPVSTNKSSTTKAPSSANEVNILKVEDSEKPTTQ